MKFNSLAYSDNLSQYALSKKSENLSKVLIAVHGTWNGHVSGSFTINKEVIEQIYTNFSNQSIDIVCDYEHQSLTTDTAPASGWIKSLSIENDKLYANVEWTDKAKKYISTKEYKYVSPVYDIKTIDRVSGQEIGCSIHSLSLTNRPFLEELGEIIANSKDSIISLKNANTKLSEEVIALKSERDALYIEKIELFVNKAITDKRLRPSQKEFAFKLAKSDFKSLQEFIQDNNQINAPQSNMFANSKTISKESDIETMVKIASNQRV